MANRLTRTGQITTVCGAALFAVPLAFGAIYRTHITRSADLTETTIVFDPLPVWLLRTPWIVLGMGVIFWWLGHRRSQRATSGVSQ
ncbi:MAG: hypothetical protein SH850_26345 [Planctomycetaceae bacterium]|nr:hypothetical protein [Planctomycetaceae bacterium]